MADTKISVNFACQRCLQPLMLDQSFDKLGEHTLAELALPIHSHPDIDLESQVTSLDHYIPPFQITDSSNGNGFMLVSSDVTEETDTKLGLELQTKAKLFDALSCYSEFDHPLCDECTDTLVIELENNLKRAQSEWTLYNEFLKKIENKPQNENLEALEKELEDCKSEEKRLLSELEALQSEEIATEEALAEAEAENCRLDAEYNRYCKEYNKHRREVMLTEDEYRNVEFQLQYVQQQLDKLKKTNVFNATFHIWHSGHFGTINNFRLGRLPSAPVDWSEINAAWGQTALLLNALATKLNLTFKRYKIVPFGNYSYIEMLSDHRELPLYGIGGFRFLWDTKFDYSMTAFLDCLQQFIEEVEKKDPGFNLPYKIRPDVGKIEDTVTGNSYFIKIQFNSEEQWTKALKFMLTNLKWGLAWVSSQFNNNDDSNLVLTSS